MDNQQNKNNNPQTLIGTTSQTTRQIRSSQNPVQSVNKRQAQDNFRARHIDQNAGPEARMIDSRSGTIQPSSTKIPSANNHISQPSSAKQTQDAPLPAKANQEAVKQVPSILSEPEVSQSNNIQNQPAQTAQVQNAPSTGNASLEQTQLPPRNLAIPRNEWTNEDYAYFVQEFNKRPNILEIKKLLHQERIEKILALCAKCDLMGLPINKEKMRECFLPEREGRWRSPLVKVCKGDSPYIRISSILTEQFGRRLEIGEEFELFLGKLPSGQRFIGLRSRLH